MNKCARNGCPNPQAANPLHLCNHHYHQHQTGTLPENRHRKQVPTAKAQPIIKALKRDNESWRGFQKRTGIPKDTARLILTMTRKHINSRTWETITEAQAQTIYKEQETEWRSHHKAQQEQHDYAATGQKEKDSPNGQHQHTPGQHS